MAGWRVNAMLDTALAIAAAVVWATAYALYFLPDLRHWWRGRHHRRALAAAERERARNAYLAWVRDMPPPPSRVPVLPPSPARLPPPPRRDGVVVPFPRRTARTRR
jgi:hypothetical protein